MEGTEPAVDGGLSDLLLVALTFGSGAVDAISFLGLGRVFTANMTGNIVLLGLAVGVAAGPEVVRSAVSLGAFVTAVFLSFRITGRPQRQASWPRRVKLVLGIEVLVQSAFLAGWVASSGRPGLTLEAVLVATSALAMGLQSGAVTALGVAGITTTYVTGTLAGLIGSLAFASGSAADRRRRAGVLLALVVGAGCSAPLVLNAREVAPVLPLAVTSSVLCAAVYAPRVLEAKR